MAVITPNTDLYLLKVPLEINDINQLDFANATAQFNYFNSLPKVVVEDYTYQRKDNTIRFGGNFDELLNYNYCMYRNTEYSDKWFYAFITNMEYINDNMTLITIKTDVWQTYQFQLTYKPCLIDREHVNDDTIGLHTLPESLELGEMICNGNTTNFGGGSMDVVNKQIYTVIEVSQVENRGESATMSYSWVSGTHDLTPAINNTERGTIPLIVGGVFAGHTSGTIRRPDQVVSLYDDAGLSGSIINMYMLPASLVPAFNEIEITVTPAVGGVTTLDGIGVPVATNGVISLNTSTFTRPTTINGYIPKNGKMFTYPFCYFNISNNAGTSIPYHYEDFNGSITFNVEGTFGVSGSTKAIPANYKFISNTGNRLDYSISGPKFPICSWNSDSYTNWLTQNAVNLKTQWTNTLLGGGLGIASGAYEGAAATRDTNLSPVKYGAIGAGTGAIQMGASMITLAREQHLAKTQANMTPDQVHGNLGAGDFLWAKYRSPFTYIPMSVKAEYARCADQFMSQFGYKCNRVKVPNIRGRRNWNYVKTVGCYIEADIPQEDLAEIKNMFDVGITIWHNPNTFADYSQNNDII